MWLEADGVTLHLEGPHQSGEALTRSITILKPGVMNLASGFLLRLAACLRCSVSQGGL